MSNDNGIDNTLVPHTAFRKGMDALEECFKYALSPEPTCIAIVGESRSGKSRLLEEFEGQHLKTRESTGLKMPVIKVMTPAKPTVKALVDLLLYAICESTGAGTLNEKEVKLRKLISNVGGRVIIVDEFQHFYESQTKKSAFEVSEWLKGLVDHTKLSLVVAGLPSTAQVINQNEQLRGRFHSAIRMPRYHWSDEGLRREFRGILRAFKDALKKGFDVPDFETEEMAFRFYVATGGLMGYLCLILRQVERDAKATGKKIIEIADFARAYEKAVWQDGKGKVLNPFDPAHDPEPTSYWIDRAERVGQRELAEEQT